MVEYEIVAYKFLLKDGYQASVIFKPSTINKRSTVNKLRGLTADGLTEDEAKANLEPKVKKIVESD